MPLDFNDPEVIRRLGAFYRNLSSLKNVFCIVCKECFPTTTTNEAGVCHRCRTDARLPKLFSMENNMDPSPVPPELCVSYTFSNYSIIDN